MAYTTIDKGSNHFNTVLYTGNGSTQSITGVGFQPDWVWLKDRDNANQHRLSDNSRGATKYIVSSETSVEATEAAGLTAFDTQKIKSMYYAGDNKDVAAKKSIHGALTLYLDFINMFLFLIRLIGNRE